MINIEGLFTGWDAVHRIEAENYMHFLFFVVDTWEDPMNDFTDSYYLISSWCKFIILQFYFLMVNWSSCLLNDLLNHVLWWNADISNFINGIMELGS